MALVSRQHAASFLFVVPSFFFFFWGGGRGFLGKSKEISVIYLHDRFCLCNELNPLC